jgi:hypothetical protein
MLDKFVVKAYRVSLSAMVLIPEGRSAGQELSLGNSLVSEEECEEGGVRVPLNTARVLDARDNKVRSQLEEWRTREI